MNKPKQSDYLALLIVAGISFLFGLLNPVFFMAGIIMLVISGIEYVLYKCL